MRAATTRLSTSDRRERALALRGLYAITPDLADTNRLLENVAAALAGGAAAIQYRNKTASTVLRREHAFALTALVRSRGALFIVNDDPELARDVGADGVHVGEDDADLGHARAMLDDPAAIVGVSCYNDFSRAERAKVEGADYVAFGSFFPSATKPAARRAGMELLMRARALGIPVVAIGGITPENAPLVINAGADAVAVISAVFDAREIEVAARAFTRLFERPARRTPT